MFQKVKISASLLAAALLSLPAVAQEEPGTYQDWTLEQCIDYALENNTNIMQSIIEKASAEENYKRSKEAFAPNISASTNQNYAYQNMVGPDNHSVYSANYGINLGMTLFSGGKLTYSKRQNEVLVESRNAGILTTQKEIKVSILEEYLQVLYSYETVKTKEKIFELSNAEFERSKAMYEVGKITKSDLAQVGQQWSQNKYDLTISKNTLRTNVLSLKQTLEIGIEDQFSVAIPEISEDEILAPLPNMMDIYHTAMSVMPKIKMAELNIKSAEMGEKVARSGWMPTISLNAGLDGSYNTNYSEPLGDQFTSSLGPTAGISVKIPIYDQRSAKNAVNLAKLNTEMSKVEYQQAEKYVSKEVETLYVDALNAQENYITAKEKLEYTQESYDLVSAQYNVGMKNTVELLTAEKNLFQAQQEVIQCRYTAIISIQLLNIMQDKDIKVGSYNSGTSAKN